MVTIEMDFDFFENELVIMTRIKGIRDLSYIKNITYGQNNRS